MQMICEAATKECEDRVCVQAFPHECEDSCAWNPCNFTNKECKCIPYVEVTKSEDVEQLPLGIQ